MRKIGFILILLFSVFFSISAFSSENENAAITPASASQVPFFGNYHALIIGIDEYKEWPPLKTAVRDAEAIQSVLVRRYGFSSKNVALRTNNDATGSTIINDLRRLASSLGEQDNLLIYFTGLGRLDDLTGDGYWVPFEGDLKDTNTWISNSIMTSILSSERVRCKNIMVIADSCYADTFFKESTSRLSLSDKDYKESMIKLASLRSRQIITTGGIEPYMDGPRGGHSLFGEFFIKALSENIGSIIDLESVCHNILRESGGEISWQKAHIGRFQTPMDKGGQFVLFDREKFIENEKKQVAEEGKIKEQAQLQKIIEERNKLEAERQRLEEEKMALEERNKLEDEKNKIEKEKAEKDRLSEEQRKAKEQLSALQEERKKLETERQLFETERAALEEKRKFETERIKIEKEKIEEARIAEARKKLEEEARRLEAEKKLTASIPKEVVPKIILRSQKHLFNFGDVRMVSTSEVKILNYEELNFFDSKWNPDGNFANDFADNGNGTATDRATGLMWQKSGSDEKEIYSPTTGYVKKLNRERFAGYNDWRVPTLEELASLLNPKKNKDGIYIDPIFSKIEVCVSADSY
ncbi:MAG: DUF1566 domain-containing protein, partial [Pseudomonadota bacterium]